MKTVVITMNTECHHVYPHLARECEWTQQDGHSLSFKSTVTVLLLLDKHFSLLPLMPLNTSLPNNQKSCSLPDAKVIR